MIAKMEEQKQDTSVIFPSLFHAVSIVTENIKDNSNINEMTSFLNFVKNAIDEIKYPMTGQWDIV